MYFSAFLNYFKTTFLESKFSFFSSTIVTPKFETKIPANSAIHMAFYQTYSLNEIGCCCINRNRVVKDTFFGKKSASTAILRDNAKSICLNNKLAIYFFQFKRTIFTNYEIFRKNDIFIWKGLLKIIS